MLEMIKMNNISKIYKKHKVLDDISLTIQKGDIYGLVGRNGAGKTTIMKIICGLIQSTHGELTFLNQSFLEKNFFLNQVGVLIEQSGFYPEMSGFENLKLKCLAHGCYTKEYVFQMLEMVGLDSRNKKAVKKYSLGMKQRLGIAFALVGDPKVLILDEPMNGLDPQGFRELEELLVKMNKEKNLTIVISSHLLQKLSEIATQFAIIDDGKLITTFSREQLFEQINNEIEIIVDDSLKAKQALKSIDAQISILSKNIFRVSSTYLNEKEIEAILVDSGIEVQSIYQNKINLEEIYLKIVEGGDQDDKKYIKNGFIQNS
ncbi:ATP-binding cassette domain-containing protein [Enterococcus hulanensis]|uniref:ATP-binding cassette domain-containing protein n=1 Tax=Enterococcus hulanensis TaxID=2559929 RepID=UPI00288E4D5A|nr:ATP-binding cassette domain-containing protein [Enterococcus hulanensis]MDT2661128.1 ATP-binding cassette domain-containing protein [Enterococcus hulanensis]